MVTIAARVAAGMEAAFSGVNPDVLKFQTVRFVPIMATNRPELDDDDDDFSELYKEYTGPGGSSAKVQDKTVPSKIPHANEDVEEKMDPNAVPTDFTSRDAKVWEAKSKATERNWKKRTEEEMICKLCGESAHFTQGCPTTLGANRKSQDYFQRVPARDRRVRRLFTEKVIENIEKEVGCRIKMDEKFLFVHGKDGTILAKGVDAVHKIIQEGDGKGSPGSHRARSRSPEWNSAGSKFTRLDSELSHLSPRNASESRQRFGRQDSNIGGRLHEEFRRPSRNSPQAYVNDGARRHSSRSKSPARHPHSGKLYDSYDADRQQLGSYQSVGWNNEKRASEVPTDREFEHLAGRQTLEELEMEYEREALDLGRIRDQQEDEENYNHRKAVGELRENHMKKLAMLRGTHAKQWEEFLHTDAQRQRQLAQRPTSGYGDYPQPGYSDYDNSPSANSHGSGSNFPMDSRCRYPNPTENFKHSRTRDAYNDFQCQRSGDYGRTYNRINGYMANHLQSHTRPAQ
ncbi:hypothetical protein V2J09_015676 [Rumex salicifolius]